MVTNRKVPLRELEVTGPLYRGVVDQAFTAGAERSRLFIKVVGHDRPVADQSTDELCNLLSCEDQKRVEDQLNLMEHGPSHPDDMTLPLPIRPCNQEHLVRRVVLHKQEEQYTKMHRANLDHTHTVRRSDERALERHCGDWRRITFVG